MSGADIFFPEEFEVHVGGYMGMSYSVEKKDNELIYKIYETGYSLKEPVNITPSDKKWNQFWDSCNRLEIWKWKKRYENPYVLDGTSWRVCIKRDNISIDSSGSNDGPPVLDKFFDSISKLLGGVDFH